MAILECRELTKYFDSSLALDHVSLTVEPRRIVGLLGPNGSGKTTLIKLANGLLIPSSGVVTIDGHGPGAGDQGAGQSYLPERTLSVRVDERGAAAGLFLRFLPGLPTGRPRSRCCTASGDPARSCGSSR